MLLYGLVLENKNEICAILAILSQR